MLDASLMSALQASVERLRRIASPLDDDTLGRPAYPSKWSIAQVLSHVGSAAEITERRLEDGLAGRPTPDDFMPSVWDRWNAKSPRQQADDALAADAALLARLDAVTPEEAARFRSSLGRFELDADRFVQMRLNEHVVHTWDVEVALDPTAGLAPAGVRAMLDDLGFIAGFAARPTGRAAAVTVATTEPAGRFTITLAPDQVTFTPRAEDGGGADADVTLPAEAFVRLCYGRLDPGHTPAFTGDADLLDELRRVYPGF